MTDRTNPAQPGPERVPATGMPAKRRPPAQEIEMPTTSPYLIHAELQFDGHPPENATQAKETLARCGVSHNRGEQHPVFADPEPLDIEHGIWLIDISLIELHNLRVDGELDRRFGPSCFVHATWSN